MSEKKDLKRVRELEDKFKIVRKTKNELLSLYSNLFRKTGIRENPSIVNPGLRSRTLDRVRFVSAPARWVNSASTVVQQRQMKPALKKLSRRINELDQEAYRIEKEILTLKNKHKEK